MVFEIGIAVLSRFAFKATKAAECLNAATCYIDKGTPYSNQSHFTPQKAPGADRKEKGRKHSPREKRAIAKRFSGDALSWCLPLSLRRCGIWEFGLECSGPCLRAHAHALVSRQGPPYSKQFHSVPPSGRLCSVFLLGLFFSFCHG